MPLPDQLKHKRQASRREEWRERIASTRKDMPVAEKITLPADVRGLLVQLYDRMDREGVCWASNASLARELESSRTQIKRWIQVARERGVLETEEDEGGRRVFRAVIPGSETASKVVGIRPEFDPGQGPPVARGGPPADPKAEGKPSGLFPPSGRESMIKP
jgi:biotin operon repressor